MTDLNKRALELADAEAAYRKAHDLWGRSDLRTGRAWDRMRHAGNEVRAQLVERDGELQEARAENERLLHAYEQKCASVDEAQREDEIATMRADKSLKAAEQECARLREVVIGWRERDWPEGFCRRTAELIADAARQALSASEEGKVAEAERRVIEEVAAERKRQITAEDWTTQHDDEEHAGGELALAAACYAASGGGLQQLLQRKRSGGGRADLWPWTWDWWKPKDGRRDLVRAGALIVAEIERLDRAAAREEPSDAK